MSGWEETGMKKNKSRVNEVDTVVQQRVYLESVTIQKSILKYVYSG